VSSKPTGNDKLLHRRHRLSRRRNARQRPETGDEVTPDHVRNVILREFDRRMGRETAWRIDGPPITARESLIYRVRETAAPAPLAVKVYFPGVDTRKIVTRAELMRAYRNAMGSGLEQSVPSVLAIMPEHRTVVMEWIGEPRLDHLLARTGMRSDQRRTLFAAAGRWLRRFHQRSGFATRPLDGLELVQRVDIRLGGTAGAGRNARDPVFRDGYEALAAAARALDGTPFPHVTAHGDFAAHNLFHGGGRTIGIDFSARADVPYAGDAFRFLVHAETERSVMQRSGLASVGRWIGVDDFMAGYGPLEADVDDRVLGLLLLGEVMLRWAMLIDRIDRGQRKLSNIPRILRFRRLAGWTLAWLDTEGGRARQRLAPVSADERAA